MAGKTPSIVARQRGQGADGGLPCRSAALFVGPRLGHRDVFVADAQPIAEIAQRCVAVIVNIQDVGLAQGFGQSAAVLVDGVPEVQPRLPEHPARVLPGEDSHLHPVEIAKRAGVILAVGSGADVTVEVAYGHAWYPQFAAASVQ